MFYIKNVIINGKFKFHRYYVGKLIRLRHSFSLTNLYRLTKNQTIALFLSFHLHHHKHRHISAYMDVVNSLSNIKYLFFYLSFRLWCSSDHQLAYDVKPSTHFTSYVKNVVGSKG